jgi:hypothetical protein
VSDAVARVRMAALRLGMTDRTVAGIRKVLAGQTSWRRVRLLADSAAVWASEKRLKV